MPDLFRIFVTVSLVNLASRGLSTLASDLLKVDMRSKQAQAAMSKLRSSLLIGGGMMMAGAGLARELGKAVDLAADVELSVTRLQSLTQGSAEQMALFTKRTQEAAHATAIFSQVQAAELGVTIEQSTKMSIDSINKTLPAFAMFAEAQQKLHGTSATTAVTAAGQMAKTMGLTPEQIPAFLEKLHRISAAMPKSAQLPALAKDVNRPLAVLTGLGLDTTGDLGLGKDQEAILKKRMKNQKANLRQQEELIELQAMLTSMGGQGATFGGRNLLMAMVRTMAPTKKGAAAQKALGITGLDEQGRFDIFKFEEQLATVRKRHPELKQTEFVSMMKALFGQNALALTTRLAGPDIEQRRKEFKASEARVDPIQVFVKKFLDTFAGAKTQLITDFASAMAEFGKHLLPVLVPLIHFLDKIVVAATNFMQANPTFTKIIAVLLALGSAGLMAGGAIVMLAGLSGFISLLGGGAGAAATFALGGLSLGIGTLGGVFLLAGIGVSKFIDEMDNSNRRMAEITKTESELLQKIAAGHGKYAKALKAFNTQLSGELSFTKNFFKDLAATLDPANWGFGILGKVSHFLNSLGAGKLAGTDPVHHRMMESMGVYGPPRPSNKNWHSMNTGPSIYHNNQVAGIGLVKIIVNGAASPKEVANEVVKKLSVASRQSAKGSGNVEELAYATPFMYS